LDEKQQRPFASMHLWAVSSIIWVVNAHEPERRWRWLGRYVEVPGPPRVLFFGSGLVAVAAASHRSVPDGVDWLIALPLVLFGYPLLCSKYGAPEPGAGERAKRSAPREVSLPTWCFALGWFAVIALAPVSGLGGAFWVWCWLWPVYEVHRYHANRSIETDGIASWQPRRPPRPARDAALVALMVATLALVAGLLDGEPVGQSLAIVSAGAGLTFVVMFAFSRRALRRGPRY
jgi:hypothetical protein